MSAFKGTPGPWSVLPGSAESADYYVHRQDRRGEQRDYVCEVTWLATKGERHTFREAEVRANAALIAQAPAMLQIVTALLDPDAPRHARVDLAMILAREVHAALREGGAL